MKSFLWRHKTLVAIWLVVFGISGYAGYLLFFKSSGNENPYVLSNSTNNQEATEQEADTEPPKLVTTRAGEAATDGSAEITVFGAKCDEVTIGTNQYAMDEATGVFCRVSISVKNTGIEPLSLPASDQKLIVSGGNTYDLDAPATQYAQAEPGSSNWYEKIAPGTTVTGDLVFDIPAAMTASKVILHASEDSGGIEVSL